MAARWTRWVLGPALALLFAGGPARADEPVLKVYDIGALTEPQSDLPGPSLGCAPYQPADGSWDRAEAPSVRFMTADDIVTAIKTNFDEDSWADSHHSITAESGTLVVVAQPAVHHAIERYLTVLRALRARQVEVQATMVELTPAALDALGAGPLGSGAGLALSDPQLATLDALLERGTEARVVRIGRIHAFPGQRVNDCDLRARSYLADYNSEIADNAAIAKPIPGRVDEGFVLDVRPMIEFGEARVTLHLRFDQQDLLGPLAAFDTTVPKMGLLHLPVVAHTCVRTTVTVAPGATALVSLASAAIGAGERRCLALLLRPAIVKPLPDPTDRPQSSEKRQFERFDVHFLVAKIDDFPAPTLESTQPAGAGSAGAAFEVAGEAVEQVMITSKDLVRLIQQNVAPESWSNTRNRIWCSEGAPQVMVVQTPEVLAAVREYLAGLARTRRRMIQVDALVLGVAGKHVAAGMRTGPLAAGAALGKEALTSLFDEARAGRDVQVLGQASVTGFNRQRVHVLHALIRRVVRDYDVELAKGATLSDPVIGLAQEGIALDVRPTLMGDGGGILLDLRPTLARLNGMPEPFDTKAQGGGVLHLIDVDRFAPEANLAVRDGEWTVAAVARAASGAGSKVLLVRARAEPVK